MAEDYIWFAIAIHIGCDRLAVERRRCGVNRLKVCNNWRGKGAIAAALHEGNTAAVAIPRDREIALPVSIKIAQVHTDNLHVRCEGGGAGRKSAGTVVQIDIDRRAVVATGENVRFAVSIYIGKDNRARRGATI